MPIASGTWGSMPPAVIFAATCYFLPAENLAIYNSVIMAILALIGSFACVKFAPEVVEIAGKKDPGEIVADEFAGQAVTFLGVSAVGGKEIAIIAVGGFLLFRFFDILKPWPIRNLEKLPNGWGILADDLLAGVFAGIVLHICRIAF